ncbi:MAG: outer membrane protein [Hyphomicrobiales bacterium]
MGCLKKFGAASALAVLFAVSAQAADVPRMPPMPAPPPLLEKSPLLIDEFSSGWYLRGDVGYRINKVGSGVNDTGANPSESKIDKSAMFGFGIGYKAKWFRTDITGDYGTRAKYSGLTGGVMTQSARVDGFSLLLNGYLDLGTWAGLTPYIGAGFGGSYLSTADYISVPALAASPAIPSKWTMSWAYMAGVSYMFHPNFLIDVGYRHIKLGNAISGPDTNRLTIKDISADEIRLGVRYLLD